MNTSDGVLFKNVHFVPGASDTGALPGFRGGTRFKSLFIFAVIPRRLFRDVHELETVSRCSLKLSFRIFINISSFMTLFRFFLSSGNLVSCHLLRLRFSVILHLMTCGICSVKYSTWCSGVDFLASSYTAVVK